LRQAKIEKALEEEARRQLVEQLTPDIITLVQQIIFLPLHLYVLFDSCLLIKPVIPTENIARCPATEGGKKYGTRGESPGVFQSIGNNRGERSSRGNGPAAHKRKRGSRPTATKRKQSSQAL